MASGSNDLERDPPSEPEGVREHLMSIALSYAGSLKGRPGLAGVLQYGSLVRGSLTPFSDVDLALFYQGEPPHRFEFRMAEGVKVDLMSFPLADVTNLLHPLPRSLDAGLFFSKVLESLLLAGNESIRYDPTGELLRVKTRLGEKVSFQALSRVSLSDGYHNFYRVNVEAARSLLEQGDLQGSFDKARWSGSALGFLLRTATVLKDTREAARRLKIPGFADMLDDLASIMAPPDEAIEAVWAATKALWDHSLRVAAGPLNERLRTSGVEDPDRLALIGNYDLFWPGEILYEFGRIMKEVAFSLQLSRYDLDQGKGEESLRHLWACRGSQSIRHRWDRLSAALNGTGYDCSSIIEPMLDDPEFVRLGERLDSATKEMECGETTPEAVRRALALIEEMERMVIGAIPFMSAEELAEWKEKPA